MVRKYIFKENRQQWFVGWLLYCNEDFDKETVSSCYLLSSKQPNSSTELSVQCSNTRQRGWQTNRWGCHMFAMKPAKCSCQLTNSSDIFLSVNLSLSSQRQLPPFGTDTWLVTCLSSSTERWETEINLADRGGSPIADYHSLCLLLERTDRLAKHSLAIIVILFWKIQILLFLQKSV